jgi:glucosyl-dolichyl phosphate glucuronosyltransferase
MALDATSHCSRRERMELSVSAVVCTHDLDRWDALTRAVESLRRQTSAPLEVVVVVDNNPGLLERVATELPHVTAVANAHASGLSGARNTGVTQTTGDLIAFLDDDAEAAGDWLERLVATFSNESVLGSGGRVVPRWLGERPRWFPEEFLWVVGCTYKGVPSTSTRVRNLYGGCFCVRRTVFEQVGGFRSELGRVGSDGMGCEETEFCIRATADNRAAGFWYEPAALITHDVPASRVTWRYFRSRCFSEGVSKARLARLVGADAGLSTERTYVRRTLPAGVAHGLLAMVKRADLAEGAQAGAIVAGLAFTAAGYLRELLAIGRPGGSRRQIPRSG